jgi:hypothetical protein
MSTCTCGSLCVGGTGANACNAVANACNAVDNRNCTVVWKAYVHAYTHTHTQQYTHTHTNHTHTHTTHTHTHTHTHIQRYTHTHTHTHVPTHTHTHNTHYLLGKKSFSLGVTLRICVMPASLNGPSLHATTTPPMNTPCLGFRV